MTNMERIEMYKEKARFIAALDLALTTPTPKGMTVTDVEYEVYRQDLTNYGASITEAWYEFIVITFKGGSKLPISVSGNSNSANFGVLAKNINGGDYSEFQYYERIKEAAEFIDLEIFSHKFK